MTSRASTGSLLTKRSTVARLDTLNGFMLRRSLCCAWAIQNDALPSHHVGSGKRTHTTDLLAHCTDYKMSHYLDKSLSTTVLPQFAAGCISNASKELTPGRQMVCVQPLRPTKRATYASCASSYQKMGRTARQSCDNMCEEKGTAKYVCA
jgi:hypothetical protein